MMNENLEQRRKKCVFVEEWDCHVEIAEIPLEVCRLCVEARRSHASNIKIIRAIKKFESPKLRKKIRVINNLHTLNGLFTKGEISIEEYLRRRREVVNRLRREAESLRGARTELEGKVEEEAPTPAGLALIEWNDKLGPVVKTTYPKGWKLHDKLNDEMITVIYSLYAMSREQTEGMCLEFKSSKVVNIGGEKEKMVLLVLDPDQDIKKYKAKIMELPAEFRRSENWEKLLPKLYERLFEKGNSP